MRTKLGLLSVILGLAILGTSWWAIDSGRVVLDGAQPSASALATPRPCPDPNAWPQLPVTAEWRDLIAAHYAAESLTVAVVDPRARLLDVHAQRVGEYPCVDAQGNLGAYRGRVPADAIAAVQVRLELDTTDYMQTPAWVTLASWGDGWRIVDIQSGPGASLAVPQEG